MWENLVPRPSSVIQRRIGGHTKPPNEAGRPGNEAREPSLTALAGKARIMTGVSPRNSAVGPSVRMSSAKTPRIPTYLPSGAAGRGVGKTSYHSDDKFLAFQGHLVTIVTSTSPHFKVSTTANTFRMHSY